MTTHPAAPWCLIPVKRLALAKGRLAGVLTPAERAGLAFAMAEDVLQAAAAARRLGGVAVVTADPAVAALARRHGARVIPDEEEAGTGAAVERGARRLAADGAGAVLVVPTDVPLARAQDLDLIVERHGAAPAVTLVPALADGGTNALMCSPPDVMAFQFGPDSLRRHREAARRAGLEPAVLALPRLGRDIDRPDDLPGLLAEGFGTRSQAFLAARRVPPEPPLLFAQEVLP